MQFGLVLPNYSAWFGQNLRPTVALAEELGFESVWVNDHIVFPGNLARLYGNQFLDPLALLPYLAACSERLLLGTTILVVPYRAPIPTAKVLATIDRLSGGRLLVGVGAGHEPEESAVLGVPYEERGRMTDEYLRIWLALWTNEPASFSGRYYSFEGVRSLTLPIQEPHPPLFIGGRSEAALRRTLRFGAEWHPSTSDPARLEPLVTRLRELAAAEGVPVPGITLRCDIHIADDGGREAQEVTGGRGGEITRRIVEPAQVRELVHDFARLGVGRIVFDLTPNRGQLPEQMRRLASALA